MKNRLTKGYIFHFYIFYFFIFPNIQLFKISKISYGHKSR